MTRLGDKKHYFCECGRSSPWTEHDPADGWNDLCAEIETGRAMLELLAVHPQDWQLVDTPRFNLGPSGGNRENYIRWRVCLRPIAKKTLNEDGLRRLLLKCYKILGEQYRGYATEPPIMDEIDSAISTTKEGETDG